MGLNGSFISKNQGQRPEIGRNNSDDSDDSDDPDNPDSDGSDGTISYATGAM